MKKKITLLSFSLTGCGEDECLNKEGEVYLKEIREETEVRESLYNGSFYDDFMVTYPNAYIVYVKYKKDFGNSDNPFYDTYAFYVSEDVYNKVEVGDKYLYNEGKDALTLNYIKKKEVIDE